MTLVRLKSTASRSRVKHSITDIITITVHGYVNVQLSLTPTGTIIVHAEDGYRSRLIVCIIRCSNTAWTMHWSEVALRSYLVTVTG